jgi:hypothetical protein
MLAINEIPALDRSPGPGDFGPNQMQHSESNRHLECVYKTSQVYRILWDNGAADFDIMAELGKKGSWLSLSDLSRPGAGLQTESPRP